MESRTRHQCHLLISLFGLVLVSDFNTPLAAAEGKYQTHPPIRPLATTSPNPLGTGPAYFLDAAKGSDAHNGSQAQPWKSLARAQKQLRPGDTLYLRGGTYHEHVTLTCSGTDGKPITIRSYPGELAIIDGGLREFLEDPANAWEPVRDGGEGEYRSVRTYPDLGGSAGSTCVLGNFEESMVPLHGYRFLSDLRSKNVYWNLKEKVGEDTTGIYCGPGVFYDLKSGRIHVRLAHTHMPYLPAADNYKGETDPRKLRLVIAGLKGGSPLAIRGARYLRLQDLVVRGARDATVSVVDSEFVECDGMTVYGGSTCFRVEDSAGLRILNTACRGLAAPWTFRGSLKYRAIESRLFSASRWDPTGRDNCAFELAYSEFTDSVDGVFIGNVKGVWFHHNYLDNVTDDGIFLTCGTGYDGTTPGGDVSVYQNRFGRCLTTFAFGVGHGRQRAISGGLQTGSGVMICRNIFDFRGPVLYDQPGSPASPQEVRARGRFASDHGSPTWEPMMIYHNTILADDSAANCYGTHGLGDHMGRGARRRIFNNIIVQAHALPGAVFPATDSDLQIDCNLHWTLGSGASAGADPFGKFRRSKGFEESKRKYPHGWGAHDLFADPGFVRLGDWQDSSDLRLKPGSPAIDAGLAVPEAWPDPLRDVDRGKPDVGALPADARPWHVGVRGRMTVFGDDKQLAPPLASMVFPPLPPRPSVKQERKSAVIVQGYPAFDAPIFEYAFRSQGVPVESHERTWLDPKDYHRYHTVLVTGNLVRAQIQPNKYSPEDLRLVHKFLEEGGTLWLTLAGKDVFATDAGREFLQRLTGTCPAAQTYDLRILAPKHAWVKHLDSATTPGWLVKSVNPREHAIRTSQGERILGTPEGHATLFRQRVGKGQLIYMGWQLHDSLPQSRAQLPTVDKENAYMDQYRIVANIIAELYAAR